MNETLLQACGRIEREGGCLWPFAIPEPQMAELDIRLAVGAPRRPVSMDMLKPWLEKTDLPNWIAEVLGPTDQPVRPVRALLMGKSPADNWAVAFHQDTTVAVKAHREVPGFGSWVNKAHFFHAQAPTEVMGRLISVRLHLDDSGLESGPLKWIPGSHRFGKLEDARIVEMVAKGPVETITAHRGEMMFMNPLLLHGSDRALLPAPRRVLHIEWADFELPGGLEWAWF